LFDFEFYILKNVHHKQVLSLIKANITSYSSEYPSACSSRCHGEVELVYKEARLSVALNDHFLNGNHGGNFECCGFLCWL